MLTVLTQSNQKILSLLNEEQKQIFNDAWIYHPKTDSDTQWHTEWECKPLGITLSLLTADDNGHNCLKRDKGSVSYFSDKGFASIAKTQGKKIFGYNDKLLQSLFRHIPGKDEYEIAEFLGLMFLYDTINTYNLAGEYSHKYKWRYKNEMGILRLTDIQDTNTFNKKVITGQDDFWYITTECRDDVFIPGITYW